MKTRIARSIGYRVNNSIYYNANKRQLGLSKRDFVDLRNNRGRTGFGNVIDFHGFSTRFSSPYWFLHSIGEIFVDEVYKFTPSRNDVVIIDCGANIGLSVLYFKQICPEAKVLAFEADPGVFELLSENTTSFGLENVELVNKAVWIDESTLEFGAEGSLGGRLENPSAEPQNRIEVQAIRLRDYLDERIDFLKIDIEGAEYAVLKDCEDRLHNVENLFIEYHVMSSEEQRLDEILAWVRQAGFRYYINAAAENQKHPFVTKKGDVYEMQLNISCYRP